MGNEKVNLTLPNSQAPQPSNRQQMDQLKQNLEQTAAFANQHQQAIDTLMLRTMQQQQVLDQYRIAIYNLELRSALLVKMLEEKGLMAKDEFDKRWPLYLKSEVGIIGPDGRMEGTLSVKIYGEI